jgi:formylglycine-generating enzyme required for sulfatase activity
MRAIPSAVVFITVGLAPATRAGTLKCPADAVKVGTVCVDKYEASVWQIPLTEKSLIKKVQQGKATAAELNAASRQLGCTSAPFLHGLYPASFPATGNWTPFPGSDPPSPGVFAASVAGVLPSACTTWFQAEEACALSGKRLLTNQEWQRAAAGTPDPGNADDGTTTCATNSVNPANTGARSACVSSWGVNDMVGNVNEWVADWVPQSTGVCPGWGSFSDDLMCLAGASTTAAGPGALIRGGNWFFGTAPGVFAVVDSSPSSAGNDVGFRCGR